MACYPLLVANGSDFESDLLHLTDELDRVRDEAFLELRERLLGEGLVPELAERAVARISSVLTRGGPGAGRAAALLLEIVEEAHRVGHVPILDAVSRIGDDLPPSLDRAALEAVKVARGIGAGAAPPEQDALDRLCDEAVAGDVGPARLTEEDVVRWCKGDLAIGDWAPDVVVDRLAAIALAEESATAVERFARASAGLHDPTAPAGRILHTAHRVVFYAVLAWRLGREHALPVGFGSHREEERALTQWAFAVAERDGSVLARLLTTLHCSTVAALRDRARARELPDGLVLPEGEL